MDKVDKLPPEDLKDILNDIIRSAECPVCFTTLRPPGLVQCSKGHVTCKPCRDQLASCAICCSQFITGRPVTLCQLLESLPRFCKHVGCGRRLQERGHRESWCVWSPTTCKFLVGGVCCDAVVPCKDLLKHLEEQHQHQPIEEEDRWECLSYLNIKNPKKNIIIYTGVFLFWVMYSFENAEQFKVTFKILPNSDHDFVSASIRVDNGNESLGIMKYKQLFCSNSENFETDTFTFILSQTDIKFLNDSFFIAANVSYDYSRWEW